MWYRISDLAAICGTSPEVIQEAATVMGKRVMAGQLTFHKSIPRSFIDEVARIRAMHRHQAQRRGERS